LRERTSRTLEGIAFFGTLVVIVITAIPYATVQPWWIALFECGAFALTAIWILQSAVAEKWELHNGLLLVPCAGLLLLALIQALPAWGTQREPISSDPFQTRLWILHFGALLLTAAILLRYTSTIRRLQILVLVVVGVGVLSAVFGLARQILGFNLPIQGYLPPSAQGTYGQFINRNHFALLMEMSLGLAAGIVVSAGVRRVYVAPLLIAIAIAWVALVMTTSRGGILAMLGQSIFLALFWNVGRKPTRASDKQSVLARKLVTSRITRVLLAAALVVIVCVGVVWVGGDSLMHRLEILPREWNAEGTARLDSTRLAIWRATGEMIQDHPLVGVGFGGFSVSITQYHNASGRWIPQQAHNDYLEILASGGVVGLSLLVAFMVILVRETRRCLATSFDSFRRAASFGAVVGLFGVAIHSFVDFGLHTTLNALICIVLIVIAVRIIPSDRPVQLTN
jgi:O-antigen ligase